MNMTWVRYANRLEEENNGLKKLLEEALDHIDQYDYEESFDLVQRIKDSLGSKPLKAVQWGDNAVTGAEELLQKVQQLERDKLKMLADLQVESEINAKGGEREYVLRGKVDQLERENAALREALATAEDGLKHGLMMQPADPFQRGRVISAALDAVRAALAKEDKP